MWCTEAIEKPSICSLPVKPINDVTRKLYVKTEVDVTRSDRMYSDDVSPVRSVASDHVSHATSLNSVFARNIPLPFPGSSAAHHSVQPAFGGVERDRSLPTYINPAEDKSRRRNENSNQAPFNRPNQPSPFQNIDATKFNLHNLVGDIRSSTPLPSSTALPTSRLGYPIHGFADYPFFNPLSLLPSSSSNDLSAALHRFPLPMPPSMPSFHWLRSVVCLCPHRHHLQLSLPTSRATWRPERTHRSSTWALRCSRCSRPRRRHTPRRHPTGRRACGRRCLRTVWDTRRQRWTSTNVPDIRLIAEIRTSSSHRRRWLSRSHAT